MCTRLFIIFNSKVVSVGSLVEFCRIVVNILEVDSIVLFWNLDWFFNLAVTLTNLGIQVITSTIFIEIFGFINHTELNSYHSELCFNLRLFLCLSDASGPSGKFHVADTYLSNVQPFAFHTHNCHLLPYRRILNILDTFVSLVEVACSEVEGKVKDWILDNLIIMVDFLEIMKSSLLDEIISLYAFYCIKMRDLQGEDIKIGVFEDESVLRLDSCLVSVEECEKFSIWGFIIFLIIFLISVFIAILILFGFFCLRKVLLGCFNLNPKILGLFLVPIDSNRDVLFAQIVINKAISI